LLSFLGCFFTLKRACFGDRTSQICRCPEYDAVARVKDEVGWAVTEGVAAEVGRVREMTEAAEAAI
jgi:hypothetical protein